MKGQTVVIWAVILLVVGGSVLLWRGWQAAPAAQPTASSYPRYVAGGQAGGDVQWLVTVPCSHKPTGWADARSACDWDAIAAVIVTPDVYAAKNQGDPFP